MGLSRVIRLAHKSLQRYSSSTIIYRHGVTCVSVFVFVFVCMCVCACACIMSTKFPLLGIGNQPGMGKSSWACLLVVNRIR